MIISKLLFRKKNFLNYFECVEILFSNVTKFINIRNENEDGNNEKVIKSETFKIYDGKELRRVLNLQDINDEIMDKICLHV